MSDLLEIGRTLGSLTTTSEQHSTRLESLETDVSNIQKRMENWLSLARRGSLVLLLWGTGTTAGIASPQIGEAIAGFLKNVLSAALTKL